MGVSPSCATASTSRGLTNEGRQSRQPVRCGILQRLPPTRRSCPTLRCSSVVEYGSAAAQVLLRVCFRAAVLDTRRRQRIGCGTGTVRGGYGAAVATATVASTSMIFLYKPYLAIPNISLSVKGQTRPTPRMRYKLSARFPPCRLSPSLEHWFLDSNPGCAAESYGSSDGFLK